MAAVAAAFVGTWNNTKFPPRCVTALPFAPRFSRGLFLASGQVITRLEYQVYNKFAVKTMSGVFLSAHASTTGSEYAAQAVRAPRFSRCCVT